LAVVLSMWSLLIILLSKMIPSYFTFMTSSLVPTSQINCCWASPAESFCFQTFIFWYWAYSSRREGVWLFVAQFLLGSGSASSHSHSLTHSLTDPLTHTYIWQYWPNVVLTVWLLNWSWPHFTLWRLWETCRLWLPIGHNSSVHSALINSFSPSPALRHNVTFLPL
jgi:hypothetical protein